jgi:hypothetical protein
MALLPASIVIGILCGVWFHFTVLVPWFIAWVGFASMASFYYAGADAPALKKSVAANIAGMLQGAVFFFVWTKIGGGSMILLSVIIALLCFVMTFEGNIGLLVAIPGQFVGASVFFGNLGGHNGEIWVTLANTAACMILGNLLAMLMVVVTGAVSKTEEEPEKVET